MEIPEIAEYARLLVLVAVEAAEEPDAISRRSEVVDILDDLADWDGLGAMFGRVIPDAIPDPAEYVRSVSAALDPFLDNPLDDAPKVIEPLVLVAWVIQTAVALDTVSEFAAVALAP
jgi:hypothetical protein